MGGNHLLVVEAHDSHILGNRKVEIAQSIIGAHRHAVIETKQGGRRVRQLHHGPGGAVAAIRVGTVGGHQGQVKGDGMSGQGGEVTLQAGCGGGDIDHDC